MAFLLHIICLHCLNASFLVFFPQQKRIITLWYSIWKFLLVFWKQDNLFNRNILSCSEILVQWTETSMKLILKSWYPLVSVYLISAFTELSTKLDPENSFTNLWQVTLQYGSEEASDTILWGLLIQNKYAWKNYATAWKRNIFAMQCSLTVSSLPTALPSSLKIFLYFQTHTQKYLT